MHAKTLDRRVAAYDDEQPGRSRLGSGRCPEAGRSRKMSWERFLGTFIL